MFSAYFLDIEQQNDAGAINPFVYFVVKIIAIAFCYAFERSK
jgi:hypothetical protein